jgi:hypothetical protein
MGISEYRQELLRPWATEQDDMNDARAIVSKYQERDGGIRLVEDVELRGDQVSMRWPDWVMDLHRHFEKKYGPEHGGIVAQKIMARMVASLVDQTGDASP